MERKLASIQRITNIQPITNSDTLSVATVLGWKVVIRTGDFQVGDLAIYFEIDSILPPLPEFEFLKASNYRLRTLRMRGQLSQGLLWWTSILNPVLHEKWTGFMSKTHPESEIMTEEDMKRFTDGFIYEGSYVTDLLGIQKYEQEIPEDMKGMSRGHHPTIVRKTGEIRVQSAPELLEEFYGSNVYATTKIEGESASFILHKDDYHVCSHTHSLIDVSSTVDHRGVVIQWEMERKYGIENILKANGGNLAIQGEIAGPGLHGNPLDLTEKQLFVFRITDLETQTRYTPEEIMAFCEKNNLQCVDMKLIENFNYSMEEVIQLAEGTYPSGNPREGIVLVPQELVYSEYLADWLSMKVINNTYLEGSWKKKRKK